MMESEKKNAKYPKRNFKFGKLSAPWHEFQANSAIFFLSFILPSRQSPNAEFIH